MAAVISKMKKTYNSLLLHYKKKSQVSFFISLKLMTPEGANFKDRFFIVEIMSEDMALSLIRRVSCIK